jgi:hypothetical protein
MARASTFERALCLVGALVLGGCHTYVPVRTAAPGTTVRVRLPIESSVEGNRTPVPEVVDVEGDVVSFGDTLVLATETTQMIGNFREVRTVDTLRVSMDRVAVVEERVFSTGRTVGLTALIVGAAAAIVIAVAGTGGGGDDNGGGNGGNGTGASISAGDLGGFVAKLFGGG